MAEASATHAQTRVPAESFPSELDRYIARVLVEGRIPGLAIAIVRNDSVLVAKGYGVRELGKPGPVDEHTVFDIASLTKSFTATAAAVLVDRGVLSWDDPVRRHLPDLELPTAALTDSATVRDFLAHRTGLDAANVMWMLTSVSRSEVLRRMRHVRIVAPFRSTMVYSNIGYSVAGEAMAAAAGTPFEALLRDLVIRPLQLERTTWSYEQAAELDNVAVSHTSLGGVQQPIARERRRDPVSPAAAVQSSAADLAKWLRLHLNGGVVDGVRLVSDSTLRELHTVQTPIATTPEMRAARMVHDTVTGYGMGWQVMDYRGHPLLWHTGSGNGQIAYMAVLPQDRLGFVVLVNTWVAPNVHLAIGSRILDTYLGFEERDWAGEALARVPAMEQAQESARREMASMRSSSPPPLPLERYAGRYEHAVFGPLVIQFADDALTLRIAGGEIADLEYHGGNSFFTRWRDPFSREFLGAHVTLPPANGRADTLHAQINRDVFTAVRARPDYYAPRPGTPHPEAQAQVLVLRGVTVIDGTGGPARDNQSIVIHEGRIAAVQSAALPTPAGARIVDLAGRYVIPGLVDAHVHVTSSPFARPAQQDSVLAFMFSSGVTSVRDLAGDAIMLGERARSAADSMLPSPRVFYSALMAGPEFLRTESRAPEVARGGTPGEIAWLRGLSDSTDMRAAVADARALGATGIKLYADLPPPIVARATAEAHAQGLKVWSHATLAPSRPSDVIAAGVDVISHVDMLVFEAEPALPASIRTIFGRPDFAAAPPGGAVMTGLLERIRSSGVLLDATLVRMDLNGVRAEADPNRPALHGMRSWSFEVARRAHALGIPFVTGTDLMGRPSVDTAAALHDELELLVTRAGHSPAEAIRAATLHGARMLGREREQGTIEVGKVADLVVVSADPLADIRNTRRVVYVIKGGELHEPALSKQILQLAQTRHPVGRE